MARLPLALVMLAGVCFGASTACDRDKVVQNFNFHTFARKWYMLRATPGSNLAAGKCTYLEYNLSADGKTFKITTSVTNATTNKATIQHPTVELLDKKTPTVGRLRLKVNGVPVKYNILALENNKYAVIHICAAGGQRYRVFSATPQLDSSSWARANKVLSKNGVTSADLINVKQDCKN